MAWVDDRELEQLRRVSQVAERIGTDPNDRRVLQELVERHAPNEIDPTVAAYRRMNDRVEALEGTGRGGARAGVEQARQWARENGHDVAAIEAELQAQDPLRYYQDSAKRLGYQDSSFNFFKRHAMTEGDVEAILSGNDGEFIARRMRGE